MTNTTSSLDDITYTKPAFSLGAFLNGGFNMPTEAQFEASAADPGEDRGMPKSFFGRLGVWLDGGYNLPTKAQFEAAPDTVVETGIKYPTGIWGWFCGSFNVPVDPMVRPSRR